MSARSTIELPNYAYVDYVIVEDDEYDYDQYEEPCFELTEENSSDLEVLFGYPSLIGNKYDYSKVILLERSRGCRIR